MKNEQVPTARVRGSLPPLGPSKSEEQPNGFVLPLYTLYSPGQVALATFLGTPLAGGWLLARNFKKLGQPSIGWVMLLMGFAWAAGLCTLAILEKLPGMVSLASIPAMVLVTRAVQGRELDRHASLGGKTTSWGYVVAAGVACLAILVAAAFGIAVGYVLMTRAPSVDAPGGGEVMYEAGATEADAIRVRDALGEMEYFDGPYTVQVKKDPRWQVSFAVKDEALRDAKMGREFGDLADALSRRAFGNEPVDIELIDEYAKPHKLYRFEDRLRTLKLTEQNEENKDEVRFRNVTDDQAKKVAKVLEEHKQFHGAGDVAYVELSFGHVTVELWMPEDTEPTALQAMFYQWILLDLSKELDAQVDFKLGDLDGKVYARYAWGDRIEPPVRVEDGTVVFYQNGGTLEEAKLLGEAILKHDEDGTVPYAIVMRDDNYEPARPMVVIYNQDFESPEVQLALHRLAEPFSKIAFGGKPVDVRVVDDQLVLQHLLSWEKRPKASSRRSNSSGAIRPTP